MSQRGRHHASRRSTDASRSMSLAAAAIAASSTSADVESGPCSDGGAEAEGSDRVALLQTAAVDGCGGAGGGSTGASKLEASATIVLDASPNTVRRPPSLKRRSTIQSAGPGSMRTAAAGWKLKYQDFVTSPVAATRQSVTSGSSASNASVGGLCVDTSADPFQKLVDRANDWLRKNVDVQVKTCETITWTSHDLKSLAGAGELMMLSKRVSEDVRTHCIRGLRLWLVPQTVNKPQCISIADFHPSPDNDHIQSLVATINAHIDQSKLKGQVISVETIGVPIQNGVVDSGATRWTECADTDIPYAFALRVYYNKEVNGRIYGSERAHIGIRDIIPQPTENTYEGFEDLIDRMNYWIKEQTDIQITNMQSVMVQKNNGPHSETGSACFYSQPGVNRPAPVDFFRILRVAYLRPIGDLLVELPVIHPLSYETFTPELVKNKDISTSQRERVEKMKETFAKVAAFLQNPGVDVVCAETVMNPMQLYPQDNVHILPPVDEIKFLLTLRLFYAGKPTTMTAPRDGSVRSGKRTSVTSTRGGAASGGGGPGGPSRSSPRNSDNSEHPGPIFLRHVVSRPFEYRWLILASTAITCMTIIVIVSVVYSNL